MPESRITSSGVRGKRPDEDIVGLDVVPAHWNETYRSWARTAIRAHRTGDPVSWLAEPRVTQGLLDATACAFAVFAFYALFSWLAGLLSV